MSNDSGSWLPFNTDGSAHICKDKTQTQKEVQEQQNKSTLTMEELDARLKKVERIVLRESK